MSFSDSSLDRGTSNLAWCRCCTACYINRNRVRHTTPNVHVHTLQNDISDDLCLLWTPTAFRKVVPTERRWLCYVMLCYVMLCYVVTATVHLLLHPQFFTFWQFSSLIKIGLQNGAIDRHVFLGYILFSICFSLESQIAWLNFSHLFLILGITNFWAPLW